MRLRQYYQKYERIILLLLLILAFTPYFLINHQTSGNVYSLGIFIDEATPFVPAFILIYITAFLLVAMPYFLIKEKEYLRKVTLIYVLVLFFSYLIFLIFPVKMLRPSVGGGFFAGIVSLVYSIDKVNNCFPSLHVAMSFLAGIICFRYDRKYEWFLIWAVLVIVSTLFVKQHYFLDLVAGLAVGMVGYWGFVKLIDKSKGGGE